MAAWVDKTGGGHGSMAVPSGCWTGEGTEAEAWCMEAEAWCRWAEGHWEVGVRGVGGGKCCVGWGAAWVRVGDV